MKANKTSIGFHRFFSEIILWSLFGELPKGAPQDINNVHFGLLLTAV